jgi:hypothetical protein
MARYACEGREGNCNGVLWRNTRRARGRFRQRAQTQRTHKNSSTAAQSFLITTLAGGTGSASLHHAACATQAEGSWSMVKLVSLGLCRMRAMRWQATATEIFLLALCETRSKKNEKKDRQNKQRDTNGRNNKSKLHLTRFSDCKLLFPSTAAAIDFAPTSPILFRPCTAHISHHVPRKRKKETQIQQEQQAQTSSHKVQRLQAAVSFYGRCN